MDIMLDLETFSSEKDAVIVSIGAVKFDPHGTSNATELRKDSFYRTTNAEDGEKLGLKISASTMLWWLRQSFEARQAIWAPTKTTPLHQALTELSEWIGKDNKAIWGNGSDFDNVVLRSSYDACGIKAPWAYTASRCHRTLRALGKDIDVSSIPELTAHNALDDAIYQALHLQLIFKGLGI